jgi:hypothetical protein
MGAFLLPPVGDIFIALQQCDQLSTGSGSLAQQGIVKLTAVVDN